MPTTSLRNAEPNQVQNRCVNGVAHCLEGFDCHVHDTSLVALDSRNVFEDNERRSQDLGRTNRTEVQGIARIATPCVIVEVRVALAWRPCDQDIDISDSLALTTLGPSSRRTQLAIEQLADVRSDKVRVGEIQSIDVRRMGVTIDSQGHFGPAAQSPCRFGDTE
jgi:hypothetical protein